MAHDMDTLDNPRSLFMIFQFVPKLNSLSRTLEKTGNTHRRIPMLTPLDINSLKELYSDLARICTRAQERRVRLVIDAEHRQVCLYYIPVPS
jgi:proline dehydrogenase